MMANRQTRRRRRRRRFGPAYKILSLFLIVAAILTGCIFFFKTAQVEVAGTQKYTKEEIAAASGVVQGDNLFLLNRHQLANRILSAFPYVDKVVIKRKLPDTLLIEVEETTVAAALSAGEQRWLINERGKLLEEVSSAQGAPYAQVAGLMPLRPVAGSPFAVEEEQRDGQERLLSILKELSAKELLAQVSAIDVSSPAVITFEYGGKYTVELPTGADYEYKLRLFSAALEKLQELGRTDSGRIDLTRDRAHFIPNGG